MADKKDTSFDPAVGAGKPVGVNPEYGKPDEDGFVGVDSMYANAANEADLPSNDGDVNSVEEMDEKLAKEAEEAEDAETGGYAHDDAAKVQAREDERLAELEKDQEDQKSKSTPAKSTSPAAAKHTTGSSSKSE